MLARENFGRRHQGGLPSGLDHRCGGQQRHDGLAGADIALHRRSMRSACEIGADFLGASAPCETVSE